jgi:hypothetical protein
MKTPPEPTDDYGHGQMMGMLVIIEMFEHSRLTGASIELSVLDTIKTIAVADLSKYLKLPEEDVYLLVDSALKEINK